MMRLSMNKKRLLLLSTVLALIAAASVIIALAQKKAESPSEQPTSSQQKAVDVCQLFSLNEAKKIFGDDVQAASANSNEQEASGDFKSSAPDTSSCIYLRASSSAPENNGTQQPDGRPAPEGDNSAANPAEFINNNRQKLPPKPPQKPVLLAMISVHVSDVGEALKNFNSSKPKSAEAVPDYGDQAYWVEAAESLVATGSQGRFSVLKGQHTINISGQNMDLKTAKKIAEVIIAKL